MANHLNEQVEAVLANNSFTRTYTNQYSPVPPGGAAIPLGFFYFACNVYPCAMKMQLLETLPSLPLLRIVICFVPGFVKSARLLSKWYISKGIHMREHRFSKMYDHVGNGETSQRTSGFCPPICSSQCGVPIPLLFSTLPTTLS